MIARLFCVVCIGVLAQTAAADVYKCVDERGRVLYTNDKPAPAQKGCSILSRDLPVSSIPMKRGGAAATPSPADFPRVDESLQRSRDNDRRKILEEELASEQQQLDDARQALQLGQSEAADSPDAKSRDRVQTLRDAVRVHEVNIDKLKKEIAGVK